MQAKGQAAIFLRGVHQVHSLETEERGGIQVRISGIIRWEVIIYEIIARISTSMQGTAWRTLTVRKNTVVSYAPQPTQRRVPQSALVLVVA